MKKIHFFVFLFCLLAYTNSKAQEAEKISAHFDKPFYVAGEDAWYKIYLENKPADIQSKVVRVEWISPDGRIVNQQKLEIKNNYAIGDLVIPYDWSEGNYLFRAYTLWGLNFGENQYFQQIIPVYNLLETPKIVENPLELKDVSSTANSTPSNLQIDLSVNKNNYKKREEINLTIQLKNKDGRPIRGHCSIAITDGNYLNTEGYFPFTESIETTNFQQQFFAEKGLSLKGTLEDTKGELLNTRFLSVFFPKQKTFEQTSVSKGELNLEIPDFYGSQPIQFFDMNPFHTPIPKLKTTTFKLNATYQGKPLYRSENAANYLFLLNQYRQYREAFNLSTPDYGASQALEMKEWEYDKTWDMEKYTALSDLASFVAEIIPEGRVVGKGTARSIRLKYEEKSIFNRLSPWYLVNDWLTEDEKIVLQLPFREVEKVEMYNSKKRIASQLDPSMVSRGLLSIHTKDGKTPDELIKKPNNMEIQGFYATRQFPKIEMMEENIPNFRPVIYWNPVIKTDANGSATIQFKTTDAIGVHQIVVVGQSKNGAIGTANVTYEVSFDQ